MLEDGLLLQRIPHRFPDRRVQDFESSRATTHFSIDKLFAVVEHLREVQIVVPLSVKLLNATLHICRLNERVEPPATDLSPDPDRTLELTLLPLPQRRPLLDSVPEFPRQESPVKHLLVRNDVHR